MKDISTPELEKMLWEDLPFAWLGFFGSFFIAGMSSYCRWVSYAPKLMGYGIDGEAKWLFRSKIYWGDIPSVPFWYDAIYILCLAVAVMGLLVLTSPWRAVRRELINRKRSWGAE